MQPIIPSNAFLTRIFSESKLFASPQTIIEKRLFKPRKDVDAWRMPDRIDWEQRERKEDRNWRMLLQSWGMVFPLVSFFDNYDNKVDALSLFYHCANSWWHKYGDDPDDICTTRMPESYAWYDMSTGYRSLMIAFVKNRIDHCQLNQTEEQATILHLLASKHARHLSNQKCISINNHGIFQAHGLMALLKTFSHLDANAQEQYVHDLIESLLENQFNNNGLHREHSPHYHFYVLDSFLAAKSSGWYEESSSISKALEKAIAVSKWLVDPSKRVFCIGDSTSAVKKNIQFDQGKNNSDRIILSDFDNSGYAVIRSRWQTSPKESSMLFMNAAYFSKTHKHRDCLSIELYEKGRRIICDGGKYGYKSDIFRHYCLSSVAHNSVEIEDFDILKCKPYGSAIKKLEKLAESQIFLVEAGFKYPAIEHMRKCFYEPSKNLLIVDELSFKRKRKATQWIHLHKDFRLVSCSARKVKIQDSEGLSFTIQCFTRDATLLIHNGDADTMRGFISLEDYKIDNCLQIGFELTGKELRFTTEISFSPVDQSYRAQILQFAGLDLNHKDNQYEIQSSEPAILTQRKDASVPITSHQARPRLLPGVPHYQTDLKQARFDYGRATYTIIDRSSNAISFFLHLKKDAKKLIVLLPGASNRSNGHLDFQRHSWSEDFKGFSVLAFSDPSIKQCNDLKIGWFQYSSSLSGFDLAVPCITAISKSQNINNSSILFFGSSAGGFAALKFGERYEQSAVIAINPQIFLFNYYREYVDQMLVACYPEIEPDEVFRKFSDRLQLNYERRKGVTVILQNMSDLHHVERHLKPLLELESKYLLNPKPIIELIDLSDGKIHILTYNDDNLAHSPPSKDDTMKILGNIFPLLWKNG